MTSRLHLRILYHQTERFSWWTNAMRRHSIEGFFRCEVDELKDFEGKTLPWTLVDYVKQTAKDQRNGRLVRGFNWWAASTGGVPDV